jgi:hypothetical protein
MSFVISVLISLVVSVLGSGIFTKLVLQWDQARRDTRLAELRHELEGQIRKLQVDLDRTVFVTRAQFDAEFEAMRIVWRCLSRLRGAIAGLRPTMSVAPVDETHEQKLARLGERLVKANSAYSEALRAVDDHSPFYAVEIHHAAEQVLRSANGEIIDVETDTPFTPQWFKEGRHNRDELVQQMFAVAKAIRARLETLSIYRQI